MLFCWQMYNCFPLEVLVCWATLKPGKVDSVFPINNLIY